MHRVQAVTWTLDNKYVLSGSDEMNIRMWKANAAEKLAPVSVRSAAHTQIVHRCVRANNAQCATPKRCARSTPHCRRSLASLVIGKCPNKSSRKCWRVACAQCVCACSEQKEHAIIRQSHKRKEANVRAHSKPGSVPYVAERRAHVVDE